MSKRVVFNEKTLNHPVKAMQWPVRGLLLLMKPDFRRFLWGPIFINLIVYSLGFWLSAQYFSAVLSRIIPSWLEWLEWLLWPLFFLTLVLITFFSFTLVANLIAAPFYDRLTRKAMDYLHGQAAPIEQYDTGFKGVLRTMGSELRRIGYFLARAIPLLLLFLIPGLNIIAPIAWVLFSAWFFALEYSSYPLHSFGVSFSEQIKIMKSFRIGATTFGAISLMGLAIPVLNILVPPSAIVGATGYILDGLDNSSCSG